MFFAPTPAHRESTGAVTRSRWVAERRPRVVRRRQSPADALRDSAPILRRKRFRCRPDHTDYVFVCSKFGDHLIRQALRPATAPSSKISIGSTVGVEPLHRVLHHVAVFQSLERACHCFCFLCCSDSRRPKPGDRGPAKRGRFRKLRRKLSSMQNSHYSHASDATPFTECCNGAFNCGENACHSCAATAAYVFPSVDASNTARKQRVVTGANET